MSQSKEAFETAIADATSLLERFDAVKSSEPQESSEVLKRAGLIIAITAWETYVEDRLREGVRAALGNSDREANVIERLLDRDLNALHNPSSQKVRELFKLYLGIDVTEHWRWQSNDPDAACSRLDKYLKQRGDAVHRARVRMSPVPQAHLVKRDDLEKAIRFIRQAVEATEKALAGDPSTGTAAPATAPAA
jgi:hypothetical protein